MQIKVNVYIKDKIFNEEFLTYTSEVDLTDIKEKKEDGKSHKYEIIIGISVGLVVLGIIIIVIFICHNRRLKIYNSQLKEKVLSIGYTAGIEKNVILKEEQTKKDADYETTFI